MVQKSRVLTVSDGAERLRYLDSALRTAKPEIANLTSLTELNRDCQQKHDLIVVDLPTAQLPQVLKIIRASAAHSDVPLLVAAERIAMDATLAGLLPKYRAMACSQSEIVSLAGRRLTAAPKRRAGLHLL